jgi:hypothetical protein
MAVTQYTFTHKQYTEQHNSLIRKCADRAPSLRGIPWHCLTNEEKARINLSHISAARMNTKYFWVVTCSLFLITRCSLLKVEDGSLFVRNRFTFLRNYTASQPADRRGDRKTITVFLSGVGRRVGGNYSPNSTASRPSKTWDLLQHR